MRRSAEGRDASRSYLPVKVRGFVAFFSELFRRGPLWEARLVEGMPSGCCSESFAAVASRRCLFGGFGRVRRGFG